MADTRRVLKPGDRVRFDGDEHLVTGLAGTSVRLRSNSGHHQVVLAGHLMAAPDFAVLDAAELPALEPFGLLESLLTAVVADAQRWREHLVEVETGLPPDAGPGVAPRAGYDPATISRSGLPPPEPRPGTLKMVKSPLEQGPEGSHSPAQQHLPQPASASVTWHDPVHTGTRAGGGAR